MEQITKTIEEEFKKRLDTTVTVEVFQEWQTKVLNIFEPELGDLDSGNFDAASLEVTKKSYEYLKKLSKRFKTVYTSEETKGVFIKY